MKLDKEKADVVLEKIKALWKPPRGCSVCGSTDWLVSDTIFEIKEFQSGNVFLIPRTSVVPAAMATCKQCGQVIFFNALLLGLVTQPDTGQEK